MSTNFYAIFCLTWYDRGPKYPRRCSWIVLSINFISCRKDKNFLVRSRDFILFLLTLSERSGCRRSKVVCNLLPIISSEGARPVVYWGVMQYCKRKWEILVFRGPSNFFMAAINVCTARSANPLERGWYGNWENEGWHFFP